ncbi:calcium-binding protein [Synechococcus sp. HK01-R]|uniref:calcium-binding protein n=1 Tax=Synechococcus sp. HK01-R TaxID=2751171 RepID=UPI001626A81B|nr:calcium-binding protein [Synechococcus sp. HK01-R]QNG27850.1 calcium-binding protein [Synechococcus sp. HK01-R]
MVLEVTEGTGTLNLAVGTTGADVVVNAGAGANDATIQVGLATDAGGNTLANGGSSVQIDPNYGGSVVVNYQGAITDGTKVNTAAAASGGGTIADNLPGGAQAFQSNPNAFSADNTPDYYINTGRADDQIEGSAANDFIRAGAGNDEINAGAGNDIVRGGAGSDQTTLGAGNDVYYLTVDQLQGSSTDTITDFNSNGDDQVQIAANIEGRVSISGYGSNKLVINLSGSETGTLDLVSGGAAFQDDDVAFV